MSGRESTLVEIGELIRSRPGLDAPPEQVAAWYERKAAVLGHLAAETGDLVTARQGRVAHAHALRLLAGPTQAGGHHRVGGAAA